MRGRRITLERALLLQIGALSAAVMVAVAITSAYLSLASEKSRILDDLTSRLESYHQVMAYMIEDVDYEGAEQVADLIAQESDIGDIRVTNRFGQVVVQRDNPDPGGSDWDSVELGINSRHGIMLATAEYQIRAPAIGREGIVRIAAVALGAGLLFAAFAYAIFRGIRARFLAPISELHRKVSAAASEGFEPISEPETPLEIVDLSQAFGRALEDLAISAERGRKHVNVLTRLLSNFGVAIRYVDEHGECWDYGHIVKEILPDGEPALAARSVTMSVGALQSYLPPGYGVVRQDQSMRAHKGAALQLEFFNSDKTYEVTLFDLGSDEVAVSVADVSRARAMEKSALEVQRMDIVGKLSSGLVHDFRNLLGVILGNAEMLDAMTDRPEKKAILESIMSACDQGNSLTKGLLSFAREMKLEAKVFDLNLTVEKVRRWTARAIPGDIRIEVVTRQPDCLILADPGMTENALLNLLLNARDAMPEGGLISIELSAVTVKKGATGPEFDNIRPGRYTVLAVRDTGVGIAQKDIASIFEPFFTSKGRDKGAGLGLAMVDGFITQTGGYVRVSSKEGVGTVFKLFFPAFDPS